MLSIMKRSMHSKGRVRVTEIENSIYHYNFNRIFSLSSPKYYFVINSYHGYELRQLELQVDGDSLTDVGHRSD